MILELSSNIFECKRSSRLKFHGLVFYSLYSTFNNENKSFFCKSNEIKLHLSLGSCLEKDLLHLDV